ncbi:hypothetical protein FKX85_06900 [Echinicola soli]|uniref:Superfamily II DNA or RNA helicase, SNF2 family n=1 Tax=Echinicola soli TaxID=2591634 RepID=A0A514CG22_9BACT|nr:DEAD/DEAH box helicase [Echinicola soli]QDH78776.1 hypothetical protein FKX85_06900 [Echinicola soli]
MKLSRQEINCLEEELRLLDPTIYQRGEQLFRNDDCELVSVNTHNRELNFFVKGNIQPHYEVKINLEEASQFQRGFLGKEVGSCECIYFEDNGECKHTAAAMLYLSAQKKGNIRLPQTSKVKSENPLSPMEIAFDPDAPNVLLSNLEFIKNYRGWHCKVEDVKISTNRLVYLLTDYSHHYELTIQIHKDNITLSCNYQKDILIKNALVWFYQRMKQSSKELNYAIPAKRAKIMEYVLAEHGLEELTGSFEDYFEINLSGDLLNVYPKGRLEGLFNTSPLIESMDKELFSALNSMSSGEQLLNHTSSDTGTYNAGIAFFINNYSSKLSCIKAIKGKGTKRAPEELKTKLDWVYDPEDASLAPTTGIKELIPQLTSMNKLLAKSNDDNTLITLHEKFLAILSIGKELPFHLLAPSVHYYNYKPRPKDLQKITAVTANLQFNLSREEFTYLLRPYILVENERFFVDELDEQCVIYDLFLLIHQKRLAYFPTPKEHKALLYFLSTPIIRFTEKDRPEMERGLIHRLAKDFKVNYEAGIIEIDEPTEKPQRHLYISEMGNFVLFRPAVRYKEGLLSYPLENGTLIDHENNKVYLPDLEEEEQLVQDIQKMHPAFAHKGLQGFFYLSFDQFMDNYWFLDAFEKLKESGVRVFGLDQLKGFKFSPHPAQVDFNLDTKPDWFEANLEVAFGNNKVKLKDLKKAVESGQNYIELSDGSIGILPEKWMEKFAKLFRSSLQDKNTLKVAKTHFSLVDELADPEQHKALLQEIAEKKARLASFKEIENTPPPKKLNAQLRHYQQEGLNWLNFLKDYGWGGILADDMGLGKTLQLISLICQIKEGKKSAPVLVVAPTTLLFNWKNELDKFAPHLDYFIHHGQRYDDPAEFKKHDVVLTSYGVVINDIELLKNIRFQLIVADESQAIKNVSSRRHRALTQLKSPLKIALSGTPIENNIAELFAQMNFVNPGFFTTFAAFKRDYANPLKKGDQSHLAVELRKKVAPFILRRTKEEVLTELPDKTEEYLYCEMGAVQRKLYDAYRNEYRDFLRGKLEEDGEDNTNFYVLEGLTRLRQICDSTALVKNGEPVQESAKINLLLEHILEKTGKHKILIFSQFVKMLELITDKLQEENVNYTYLDGKTSLKEREKRVKIFQENEENRVFLISLKAGGTGLNLTAADYVYIVDPWWNPATENQAIDRCYRMGQKKNVFAYRMVCKNTVEEKILHLQEAKMKLSKDIIGEGSSILSTLTKDSLLELFS